VFRQTFISWGEEAPGGKKKPRERGVGEKLMKHSKGQGKGRRDTHPLYPCIKGTAGLLKKKRRGN